VSQQEKKRKGEKKGQKEQTRRGEKKKKKTFNKIK